MKKKEQEVEGGSPSRLGRRGESKHDDDSMEPSEEVKEESIEKSEKNNMTDEKGYNETPPTVPVKSDVE